MSVALINRELVYRRFLDGEWTPCELLEDEEIRNKLTQHKTVYSVARHSVVLNEPFSCEKL